ncbi:MAG: FtsX-like permease family protein [Candidatus Nomurabacteria bacterium]|nr:MAG: FtsX-like permease family protein [Candidatus Nomurabacteria bacterium]
MRLRRFLFRLALLNTFKRRFRASLAVGGIALSSGVMVLLFGVSDGLKSLVTQEISNTDTANVITVNQRNVKEVILDQTKISTIKSISGVADVQQLVGMVGDVQYHGSIVSLPLYAVTSDFFRVSPAQILSGTTDGQPKDTNIIMSTKALDTFGLKPKEAINRPVTVSTSIPSANAADGKTADELKVSPAKFTIVGSIERGNLPVAYVPMEYMVQHGLQSVSQLKVTVTYPEKMSAVRESIEQMGYQTSSIQDSIDQVNRVFSVIQSIILLFGVIALVITVVGTFNVITLTLIEEMRQIGFLRLMGMKKRAVGFLFIAQAIMLTVVGAVIGSVFGVVAGFAANGAAQSLVGDTLFTGRVYVFSMPTIQIIIILMLSILLGWLIGFIPAKKAVKVGPLEELRS